MLLLLHAQDNGEWPDRIVVEALTYQELRTQLERGDFGRQPQFLAEWDGNLDAGEYILIDGRIIHPYPAEVEIVKRWEFR